VGSGYSAGNDTPAGNRGPLNSIHSERIRQQRKQPDFIGNKYSGPSDHQLP